jgi:hypothetical protein
MAFTDNQVMIGTVASTSETNLATINVPSGRVFTITSLWGAGAGGGTYRIAVDTYPSMQGVRVQNSSDPTQIGATLAYSENISVSGPAEIKGYVTNLSSSSTSCKINIEYVDSAGATN